MTLTKEQLEEVINATFLGITDPGTFEKYIEIQNVLKSTEAKGLAEIVISSCPALKVLATVPAVSTDIVTVFLFGILVGQRLEATNKLEELMGK